MTIEVSSPCALLIEKEKGGYTISVTDPEMNKDCTEIRVKINGKSVSCAMPQGRYGGKSTVVFMR
ncbi:hypothetical protein JCM10512_2024 [Bacteroides reticulotermitis JCM 10512]|uniref:Polysaccharide lyase family 8 C-terminal domain-containing protein n=2 Tax=Bacteroides reticulotermitis TaxID=1133319 RepID=W4URA3_9BACE|nr:hypothetical protein JCM10512_2024 [Bacteroides reticulotermitis JCM 10512]